MATRPIPADLLEFLRAGRQFRYKAEKCEAGRVRLRPLEKLRIQRFPSDPQSSDVEAEDPHRGEGGCYLVRAVDLVGECDGDYEPEGLLLWLVHEKRYATWDSSHPWITMFAADVSWTQVAKAPWTFINAQWQGAYEDSAPTEPLRPWLAHEFHRKQLYSPLD